jgi:hypothetical protein
MLAWRRIEGRGLCLGIMGALRPRTVWSTLCLQASHMVPLRRSSGASIHLSRWPHILLSTHGWLLHLELCSWLGYGFHASTVGRLGTSPVSVPSLDRVLLPGPCHHLLVSQRLQFAHCLRGLVVPTSLRWRRFLLVRRFLPVRSFCTSTRYLFCLILELRIIS